MKKLYITENIAEQLNEMKDKILLVAGDFIYKPATSNNIMHLNTLINEIISKYNFIFSAYNFRVYVHLDTHGNKLNIDIRFKELSTNKEIILEIFSVEEEQ